jgi:tetratricopeptide (TPR) repeat protein/uncharacterized membrane protein HdeD (DUF308 family)
MPKRRRGKVAAGSAPGRRWPRDPTPDIWPGTRNRIVPVAGLVLIAVITLTVYGQTLSVPTMNYEDVFYLVRDPYVNVSNPAARVGAVWTEPYFANFHPVTTTTWLVDRAFADATRAFDARPFRAAHLVYAMVGAALVMVLFWKLGLPPILAVAGAGLFAAHPVHTEVVAWLSARKDLTVLITAVAGCICYLRARESRTASEWRLWHILGIVLSLLAVLSKPVAVILPPLFIAYEFCAQRPTGKVKGLHSILRRTFWATTLFAVVSGVLLFLFRSVLMTSPSGALMLVPLGLAAMLIFFSPSAEQLESFRNGSAAGIAVIAPPILAYSAVSAAGSAWTFWAQSAAGAIKGGLPLVPTLNLTFDAMLTYIGKAFVPAYMSASYVWPAYPYLNVRGALGALVVTSVVAVATRLAKSPDVQLRLMAYGIFWFFIALVPVSNLIPTSTKMADRYLFLPTIGSLLVMLAGFSWLVSRRRVNAMVGLATLTVVLVGYAAWAYQRTAVWCGTTTPWNGRPHPDLSLWSAAVETHPDDSSALTNLALVYLNMTPAEPGRAFPLLQRALELSEAQQASLPDGKRLDISPLHHALGNAYLAFGRVPRAIADGPDARAQRKDALQNALHHLVLAEAVPIQFAPADARLQLNLADARERIAAIYHEDASTASNPETRDMLVRERDRLREAAFGSLDRAHQLLLKGGVSSADPDFRAVLLEKGTVMFLRGTSAAPDSKAMWFRKALGAYREAASAFPDDPRPVFYAGLSLERLSVLATSIEAKREDFASAEAAYRGALSLQTATPDYHPLLPYRALASLYESSGDPRAALQFLKKVRELDPAYSRSAGVDRELEALEQRLRR